MDPNTATVTRNRAICMYYSLEPTEENLIEAPKRFQEEYSNAEICYLRDPLNPVAVRKKRIYGCPFIFKIYPESTSK